VRLLGVGCSGLTTWVQDDLFDDATDAVDTDAEGTSASNTDGDTDGDTSDGESRPPDPSRSARTPNADSSAAQAQAVRAVWRPGQDVEHTEHGRGWVWGSGAGVVTVRFEHRLSPPGPVRSFAVDDPALATCDPLPLPTSG
jgi:DNA polymerase-4